MRNVEAEVSFILEGISPEENERTYTRLKAVLNSIHNEVDELEVEVSELQETIAAVSEALGES